MPSRSSIDMTAQFDIVVAGSGIAGRTAAMTSARLGLKTLVLTGEALGGQLLGINRIDGFPGFPEGIADYDPCPMAQEQAQAAGAEFAGSALVRLAARGGRWHIRTSSGADHLAAAVILATGARLKELGIPGEERLRGKGVSHCASCDAPLLRERTVAVVGGGDSAAQEALTLAGTAARVVILCRGAALTAQACYRDRVLAHPKIALRCNTVVDAILGDVSVTGVTTRDLVTDTVADLDSSGIFVYVGLQPNSAPFAGLLPLDPAGRVPIDGVMRTALPGVCAAGAVRSGWLGRAAISAGEGAAAAIAACHYLGSGTWLVS